MPTLVLLRHGESAWNAEERFAGWVDVPLTVVGARDAIRAAAMLRHQGYVPAGVHTSVLSRSRHTARIVQQAVGLPDGAVRSSWRLNERHYGALQGMSKSAIREAYGDDLFRAWRRSLDVAPPPIAHGSEWDVPRDRPYFGLESSAIPYTESLADVMRRILPYWYDVIAPELRELEVVLVVAHSNALRALVAFLDGLTGQALVDLNIPTAQPLVYELDDHLRPTHVGGRYLAPASAASAAARVANEGQPPLQRHSSK